MQVVQLYKAGKYADATPIAERALVLTEKRYSAGHIQVGTSLTKLAELYRAQGRFADAEQLLKRSLAIFEKARGPNHRDMGLPLNNLAAVYRHQGRYAEAEPLHKRSLAIAEKALGPDHPDVGNSLNGLAMLSPPMRALRGPRPGLHGSDVCRRCAVVASPFSSAQAKAKADQSRIGKKG
ncbi:MAG TPA: tetratricopeptide repeat protein [Methyloceanibacter sp.]|nr:tetratricopeptide repeat protein [Methyloceanibacter sp.]